ncbi:hypothetical protein DL96DRAFT_1468406 [Flagelloscypha sp. PMI_526]|nr:hypothetical protein DL96DRAFT_1468406 [Flagelloscypha sp. PMI_526]
MNIEENVWAELERLLRERDPQPQSEDQLWAALQEAWVSISQDYIDALYESIPHRIDALVSSKGWNTKY